MKFIGVRHLHDDTLYDAYLAARRGTLPDPRIAEHLTDCATCRQRYLDVTAVMDECSEAAEADIDELFPPDRLHGQQLRILDRVQRLGRPARVLNFPVRTVARRLGAATPRVATRWVAGAAAAGLFVGLGMGVFFDNSRLDTPTAAVASSQPTSVTATRRPGQGVSSEADEEAFLSDLDMALQSPRTRVLLGYDALTPHVRDVVDIR